MRRGRCSHRPVGTFRAAMSKPSGGIRSLLSLSVCGLPTPIVALACIGNVDIRLFFLCKWATLFHTAFASLHIASPERGGEPPLGGGGILSSLQQPTDFTRSYASFFSLLKRKKEAKKEKSSHSTCIIRFKYHPKFPSTKIPRRGIQAAAAAVTLPFLQLKLGRKVSGDPPQSPGGAYRRLLPP